VLLVQLVLLYYPKSNYIITFPTYVVYLWFWKLLYFGFPWLGPTVLSTVWMELAGKKAQLSHKYAFRAPHSSLLICNPLIPAPGLCRVQLLAFSTSLKCRGSRGLSLTFSVKCVRLLCESWVRLCCVHCEKTLHSIKIHT